MAKIKADWRLWCYNNICFLLSFMLNFLRKLSNVTFISLGGLIITLIREAKTFYPFWRKLSKRRIMKFCTLTVYVEKKCRILIFLKNTQVFHYIYINETITIDGNMVNYCHKNLSCEKYWSQTFVLFFVAHESISIKGA